VSALSIKVDTDKGVVKLSGNAKSKDEAAKAESIAKSVNGVTSVKNDIQVTAGGKK
jgi:hyperosmotically inducible protein